MPSSRLRLALSSILGASILGGLLWYVGPMRILDALEKARLEYLGLAVVAYVVFFALRGLRWRALLQPLGARPGVSTLASITAVGWLLNSIVPMRGGEFARAAIVDRRYKTGFVATAATVAVERVLDVVGIAAFASLGLYLLPRGADVPAWFATALEVAWIAPVVCVVLLIAAVRAQPRLERALAFTLRPAPARWHERVRSLFAALLLGSRSLVERPRSLVALIPVTLAMTAAQISVFLFIFLAFVPDAHVGLLLAGFPFFLLSFVLTITPGNVGTYELAFAAVFTALGFAVDVVVPLAVLTHLLTTLIVAVLGALGALAVGWTLTSPPDAKTPPEVPA